LGVSTIFSMAKTQFHLKIETKRNSFNPFSSSFRCLVRPKMRVHRFDKIWGFNKIHNFMCPVGREILQDPSIDGSGKTQGPNRSDFFEALRIRNSKGFNLFGFLKDLGFWRIEFSGTHRTSFGGEVGMTWAWTPLFNYLLIFGLIF